MRNGNCLVALLALLTLIWLVFMGGCQLIKKKTLQGLEDKPAPVAPATLPRPEASNFPTPVEKK